MEAWRTVWRKAATLITTVGLKALMVALEEDDPRLLQGATTTPPPLQCVQDWPCEAGCLLAYTGWQNGEGLETVADVEEYFARLCFEVDNACGEPAACRWLLNYWDETPREEVRRELLAEVRLALAERDKPIQVIDVSRN